MQDYERELSEIKNALEQKYEREIEELRQSLRDQAIESDEIRREAENRVRNAEATLATAEAHTPVWQPWDMSIGNMIGIALLVVIIGRLAFTRAKRQTGGGIAAGVILCVLLLSAAAYLFYHGTLLEFGYVLMGLAGGFLLSCIYGDLRATAVELEAKEELRKFAEETKLALDEGDEGKAIIEQGFRKILAETNAEYQAKIDALEEEKASLLAQMKRMKPLSDKQIAADQIMREHAEESAHIKTLPLSEEKRMLMLQDLDNGLQEKLDAIYNAHRYNHE